MENWKKKLADSITSPDQLSDRFGSDASPLAKVVARYPMRITPHYFSLIREPGDPIWRQCVPDQEELADGNQLDDPLDEENLSPVPGLIHRYPDRAVLLVSNACAVYCRFCMRKRHVGCRSDAGRVSSDVIISGGDPLLLEDDRLEQILCRLRAIPHVEIIRIGTRIPVTLPERVTVRLCRMLKRYQPLFINTHFNHPLEITAESSRACSMLANAGIPLGNQTVLLRGVNDDPCTMTRLMQQLLTIRVRPYYIHQMDLVRGTRHFRTTVARGIGIMEALRGHTRSRGCFGEGGCCASIVLPE